MSELRFSCELYPPKGINSHGFWRCVGGLESLRPEFMSLTHGALGSGTESNFEVLRCLTDEATTPIAGHLTCIGRHREELIQDLNTFRKFGIKHIVALRGDLPQNSPPNTNGFQYAEQLVQLCAELGDFEISVGAYPETHPDAPSAQADFMHLNAKLNAGATRAVTQFFFEASTYLTFRDKAMKFGIEHNLVPGVLPIGNFEKVANFAAKCGTQVPTAIAKKFEALKDDRPGSEEFAHELIAGMCSKLHAEGVNDFHFYTLNRCDLTQAIVEHLKSTVTLPKSAVA